MNKTYKYTLTAHEKKEISFDTGVARLAIANGDGVDGSTTVIMSEITKQHSGDLVSFIDGADAPFAEFIVNIVAQQSGSGDPSPTNVRPITGWTGAKIVDDSVYGGFINWNQLILDAEAHKSGTPTTSYWITTNTFSLIVNHKYILVRSGTYSAEQNAARVVSTISPTIIYDSCIPKSGQYQSSIFNCTETRNSYFVQARVIENEPFDFYLNLFDLTQMFGSTIADYIYSLEQATTGAGVAYFRNLFPHNYYDYNSGEVTNVSAVNGDTDKYNTVDINWQSTAGTVYGGTLDVLNGTLKVTHANIASYDGETINEPWISSMDKYVAGATPTTGAQVVYPLTDPITYQLTPTEIRSLLGTNNVWADCGPVNVRYFVQSTQPMIEYIDDKTPVFFDAAEDLSTYDVSLVGATSTDIKNYLLANKNANIVIRVKRYSTILLYYLREYSPNYFAEFATHAVIFDAEGTKSVRIDYLRLDLTQETTDFVDDYIILPIA